MMRYIKFTIALSLLFSCLFTGEVMAQDGNKRSDKQAVDIFLDDERLDVEADIPSVDLVMSYRAQKYELGDGDKSFVKQIVDSAKRSPF